MEPTTLPTTIAELRDHLRGLYLERAAAETHGLLDDAAYVADLNDEIAACRVAYVGTAVTEIAALRGELSGRLDG